MNGGFTFVTMMMSASLLSGCLILALNHRGEEVILATGRNLRFALDILSLMRDQIC